MSLSDRIICVYQDGVRIVAYSAPLGDVGYALTIPREGGELILDEREARELAAALAWILSEVDRKIGRPSFRPTTTKHQRYLPPLNGRDDA